MPLRRCQENGFTLVELVSILIIVAVIGVTASSRFISNSSFELQESRDQVLLAFRSAQQLAMTQSETVRFQSSASQIDVQQNGSSVLLNAVQYPLSLSNGSTVTSTTFDFDRLGRTDAGSLTVSKGGTSVALAISSSGHIQ